MEKREHTEETAIFHYNIVLALFCILYILAGHILCLALRTMRNSRTKSTSASSCKMGLCICVPCALQLCMYSHFSGVFHT